MHLLFLQRVMACKGLCDYRANITRLLLKSGLHLLQWVLLVQQWPDPAGCHMGLSKLPEALDNFGLLRLGARPQRAANDLQPLLQQLQQDVHKGGQAHRRSKQTSAAPCPDLGILMLAVTLASVFIMARSCSTGSFPEQLLRCFQDECQALSQPRFRMLASAHHRKRPHRCQV